MSIEKDWAERVRRLANQWNEQTAGHQLIHRKNFDTFIAIDKVASWQQFQDVFTGRFQRKGWAFRGQEKSDWPLATALERACLRTVKISDHPPDMEPTPMLVTPDKFERDLLLLFQRRAHHYIPNLPDDSDVLGWVALMQHYGVPTRLLDWTFSPYVALYFAIENSLPDTDCAVWAIDTHWLTNRGHEALLNDSRFPKNSDGGAFNQYLNRILFERNNPNVVVVADPIRMSERAAAQQGVFLYDLSHSGAIDIALLQMLVSPMLPPLPPIWKIVVNTTERFRFLRELNRMNIHGASLFPGLDGFAKSLNLDLKAEIDESIQRMSLND